MIPRLKIVLVLTAIGVAQAAPADRESALRNLREFSRSYEARLADFRCNKVISRSATRTGKENKWKHVDESEEEIYYLQHREHRRIISIDGRPAEGRTKTKYGYTVGGEFGLLGNIFSDKARPLLDWDHQEGPDTDPICVFRYRVERTAAPLVVRLGRTRVELAHHGTIHSRCDTGAVTRLDTASDPDPDYEIDLSTSIRFEATVIGDKQFQLPRSAEDTNRIGKQITRANVMFRNYRKFDASSQITFDSEEQPAPPD